MALDSGWAAISVPLSVISKSGEGVETGREGGRQGGRGEEEWRARWGGFPISCQDREMEMIYNLSGEREEKRSVSQPDTK